MNTVFTALLFAFGIFLIVKGGDLFVDAASWIAEAFGIPKFIVGATIVSFATTLPELLVSAFAALAGKVDMAAGNAIGSVTANVGLIMGISIVCIPAAIKRTSLLLKSILLTASCIILLLLAQTGAISGMGAVVLVAIFIVFMIENVIQAKKSMNADKNGKVRPDKKEITTNLTKFVLGTAGIVIGAQLLVDNGSALARLMGISEAIIGVTLIAVGTSLPELVTTITAIRKKQASMSIGNIIGANIIDLTMILPVCALISGGALPVGYQTRALDLPVCLAVIAIAVLPALISERFRRWQGCVLLGAYAAYLFVLITQFT